jgi:hypothetical protein
MSWGGVLAGGVVGTVVMTSGLRGMQEVGYTRMDLPLLLGTIFTGNRSRAAVLGYAIHFANGVAFAALYGLVFWAVGTAGWIFGAALGLVHALFAGTALVNILLPAVHPRMGTVWTDAEEAPLLEPPGFMLANYGRRTILVTVAAHVVYGAIVGGFAAGLGWS